MNGTTQSGAAERPTVLEVGAGEQPHPEADVTLDIREDLAHIDHPGVDVGCDEWPMATDSVDRVVADNVIEHVPPDRLGHVWREADRVLVDGGVLDFVVPHAGTWDAATDPTHRGTGGWTADVDGYFTGNREGYWTDLEWDIESVAVVRAPSILRPSLQVSRRVRNGHLSHELVKLPFVTATVEFHAKT